MMTEQHASTEQAESTEVTGYENVPGMASEDVPGSASLNVSVADLYRILYNASLFVGKDQTRGILTCINLTITDASADVPNTITAEATDSYVLAQDSCTTAVGSDVIGSVTRTYALLASDLAPVIKALKSSIARFPKNAVITLYGSDYSTRDGQTSDSSVVFKIDGATSSVPTYTGDYPNTAKLYDDAILNDAHQLTDGVINLNPANLALFAKCIRPTSGKPAQRGSTGDAMTFHFNGPLKAVYVTMRDYVAGEMDGFRALVMPCRDR